MLNVINKTPFTVTYSIQNNLVGHGVVCVFVAASFWFSNQRWHLAHQQSASPLRDIYWSKETPSSIRIPSQLSHDKPGTDIIVNANAVAPNSEPVTQLQTTVRVGDLQASVIVFGDRIWSGGHITPPRPFYKMPITWEQAFGGSVNTPDGLQTYRHNSFGIGWSPTGQAKDGTRLPNIEWPDQLIRTPMDSPIPAGYGAIGPESPLRSCFAGTYDEVWKKTRAPYVPDDFDPAFFYSAIPALRSPNFLQGDEAVQLVNLARDSDIDTALPGGLPSGQIAVGKQNLELLFNLETVVLDTTVEGSAPAAMLEAQLFWRATVPTSRSVADIKDIRVWLSR